MSLKPLDFALGLTSTAEWIVVRPMFTADISVGPSQRTLGFSGCFYNWRAMFLSAFPERKTWSGWTLAPLHLAYSLAHLWTVLKISLCLGFRKLILFKISPFHHVCCNTKVSTMIITFFYLWMRKAKEANDAHNILDKRPYLAHDTEESTLIYYISSFIFVWDFINLFCFA